MSMKIESKKVSINAPREEVFNYVSHLDNFKDLLPMDKISDWEGREDYCSFKIQGTATIDLHLEKAETPSFIQLKSGEKAPFPINMDIFFDEADAVTNVYQEVTAEVNPFLKMMVQKPLTNLFDFIADRLQEKFNSKA
jgi:carbon monoxide dehydrogenase subunit G